jgi:hypothetical protein
MFELEIADITGSLSEEKTEQLLSSVRIIEKCLNSSQFIDWLSRNVSEECFEYYRFNILRKHVVVVEFTPNVLGLKSILGLNEPRNVISLSETNIESAGMIAAKIAHQIIKGISLDMQASSWSQTRDMNIEYRAQGFVLGYWSARSVLNDYS